MNSLPSSKKLGRNAGALRMRKGWDSAEFARRLNWHLSAVLKLETGDLDATLDQLDELCAALDVTPHDLFGEVTIVSNQDEQRRYG